MSKTPNSPVKSAAVPKSRRPALRLTYVIGSLDRILRRRMSEALAPLGLTLAQFTALSVLDTRGQASNAQLAERSFITPQSANEVMNAMASRGWVSREPDPMHGRIVLLELTEQGRTVLREGEQAVQAIERQMTAGTDADAAAALQGQLETFVRNLRG
ncbi:MarR family winged helix-turn-helix transcriptional regulator [Paraburkholderia sp. BCC1886]|uniref:MarR family winged helix-turn-helix transcriptional regulator n=1 Tax=Paraburkholderia sp. BCC1886 TaxID=2562670 RepID=UPI001183DDCB|nr:MarR family transcriptional regulator [Paraburkholderia sp. BCC1886]